MKVYGTSLVAIVRSVIKFLKWPLRKLLRRGGFANVTMFLLLGNIIGFLLISSGGLGKHLDLRSFISTGKTTPTHDGIIPVSEVTFNQQEEEHLVEKSYSLSQHDLVAMIQAEMSNLPWKYFDQSQGNGYFKQTNCSKYPNLYDINFNNMYWQTLKTRNVTFYLYNAYHDNRTLVNQNPVIRILGMVDRLNLTENTFCQLWFNNFSEAITVPVYEYKHVWVRAWGNYKNGLLQPYLISCQIPKQYRHVVPESVSLTEQPCTTATTNLRVINNRPESGKKEGFAVCVKGLDVIHDDLSVRLIEWLELLFILGANKVYMYALEVHPNISRVLDYYKEQDRVDVTKITLPGHQPNVPGLLHMYLKAKIVNKRQNELIPYNDCFYKSMNKYEYVVLLDIDEIIIPKTSTSWSTLLSTVKAKANDTAHSTPWTSYAIRNVYFMDSMRHSHGWIPGIPKYLHMLQHVYRSKNYTKRGAYVKCFHDTERILTLHNHFPLACLGNRCSAFAVDTTDAQLQHYRTNCVADLKKVCEKEFKNHTVSDTTILKYRDELIYNVKKTLTLLGFLQ